MGKLIFIFIICAPYFIIAGAIIKQKYDLDKIKSDQIRTTKLYVDLCNEVLSMQRIMYKEKNHE